MDVSVVIPVYNSELSLRPLVAQLLPVLQTLCDKHEVIFVNDGSPDGSRPLLDELAATHEHVRAIHLMRNYGQHNAILCGIRSAVHGVIVTMDDDLEHPPEELGLLLDRLDEGYDVVYGTPARQQHGFWRNMASSITKLVLKNAMGVDVARNVSAFRAFRSHLRSAFDDYSSPFVCIDVLLTWGGNRFSSVSVRHDERTLGTSNYTLVRLITHAVNMLTGFSTFPLQLASLMGFAFAFFGFFLLIYVLVSYAVRGTPVQGFPFIAATISVFSGVQLFSLGIIGEYLARMHFRLSSKPAYVVEVDQAPHATGPRRTSGE